MKTLLLKSICRGLLVSLLIGLLSLQTSFAGSSQLTAYELSGVVINEDDSIAVLFNTVERKEFILREGDFIAGCVVDYIIRSRVNFYCDDQLRTLSLRSLDANRNIIHSQVIWETPISISSQDHSEIFNEPSEFVEQLNLVPHLENGKEAALEIKKVRTPEVSEKLDLQEGDLIVSVNGVAATDETQFPQAFEQIKYTQTVDLELIREGTRYYKSYLLADN